MGAVEGIDLAALEVPDRVETDLLHRIGEGSCQAFAAVGLGPGGASGQEVEMAGVGVGREIAVDLGAPGGPPINRGKT